MNRGNVRTLASVIMWAVLVFPTIGRAGDGDVAAMIRGASSAAEHEKIAHRYEQEAARLRGMIAEHTKMSAAYLVPVYALPDAGQRLKKHCDTVIQGLERAAGAARALAEEHRALAARQEK